jgi:hypothetical protein
MFALFNSKKEFIGFSGDMPDHPNSNIFKIKINEDKRDLTKWRWIGDFFNGKMINIKDLKNSEIVLR